MPKGLERKSISKKATPVSEQAINKACEIAVNKALAPIGVSQFTCYCCGKLLDKNEFYKNTDPRCETGVSPICKKCSQKIVYSRMDEPNPEKVSVDDLTLVLSYLNKPLVKAIWNSTISEVNTHKTKKTKDYFSTYMKNIALPHYLKKSFIDSDDISNPTSVVAINPTDITSSQTLQKLYSKNKHTVISSVGYDPFEDASNSDKPFMYNKLCGLLGEGVTDDEVKLGACIEITNIFNQAEKINQLINDLQSDKKILDDNIAKIKTLADTKKNLFSSALALAKENGITIANSNRNSKGADTWTGKVKEMRELDFREGELNAFDIETCEGMRQVAELSVEAIFKQLAFDENDYTSMIKQQREIIEELQQRVGYTMRKTEV